MGQRCIDTKCGWVRFSGGGAKKESCEMGELGVYGKGVCDSPTSKIMEPIFGIIKYELELIRWLCGGVVLGMKDGKRSRLYTGGEVFKE